MLTRAHRFHGYNSLRGVYGRGQTVRVALLSLKFATREPARPYRVAVVVSRKVSKSAVVRNRIRRRVYEIVKQQDGFLPPGLDLVFTAFGDELASLEPKRLESLVTGLLRKAAQTPVIPRKSAGPHDIVNTEGKQ
jgi:ribonuclease P protein component